MKTRISQISAISIFWLIVMGGPMSVNDERQYPWPTAEKKFIADAIANGKIVLGVCLGAQLIANALGARVYPNHHREIGWFPVEGVTPEKTSVLGTLFPSQMNTFHWHGETFDLPEHAIHLARSEGCEHQAFCIGDRVLGLQFHLEATPVMIRNRCSINVPATSFRDRLFRTGRRCSLILHGFSASMRSWILFLNTGTIRFQEKKYARKTHTFSFSLFINSLLFLWSLFLTSLKGVVFIFQ